MEYIGKRFYHHWDKNQEYLIERKNLNFNYNYEYIISWNQNNEKHSVSYSYENIEDNFYSSNWILIDGE